MMHGHTDIKFKKNNRLFWTDTECTETFRRKILLPSSGKKIHFKNDLKGIRNFLKDFDK